MDKQPRMKINIPMAVACVLLCLTLFSCHMTGGLYAKYSSVTSGSDSARVARFDVSDTGEVLQKELLLNTTPGTIYQTIHVVNNSEVAVNYIVTIENTTRNIPYAFSVNKSTPTEGKCSVSCFLEPNSESDVPIEVIWQQEGALKYMGMVDYVKLTVRAEQAD